MRIRVAHMSMRNLDDPRSDHQKHADNREE